MLEFYQAYADYRDLMDLTEALLSSVARDAIGTDTCTFDGETISLAAPYRRLSLREAAREAASRRLGAEVAPGDLRDRDKSAALADRLGVAWSDGAGAGRITTSIFEALCEASLVQPTFVYDFPTEVSPLSKQRADDPDTVERFELYAGRFEVANAFSELNDPAEQRRRFEMQLADRARATRRRTRWTRTTSGPSSTGCRRRRRGRRHRPPRHAAHRQPVHPGRHPVPADAPPGRVT